MTEMAAARWVATHPAGGGASAPRFRADIQGLRAVAILLVLVWHAGFGFLPAGYVGVDAFFVISGFLITGLLIEERQRTGRVSLGDFYARRAKRLLPASALVIVSTVALSLALVPQIRWDDLSKDALASALYVENWRLAGQSVDYVARDVAPSPFQHYWSLAVEEQFYFLWPVVIVLLTPTGSIRSGRFRRRLALGVGAVFAVSLVWSVVFSRRMPGPAYFVTTTRAWELALGAGIALLAGLARWSLDRRAAIALAWAGLAAVVLSAAFLPTTTPFPGAVALVPTLGTAAVILGGREAGSAGPVALLGRRPMVAIGALSYSLYLWHWPLLVVLEARRGELPLPVSALVVFGSIIPAYLTYRFVERPARDWSFVVPRQRGLALGAACTVLAASAAVVLAWSAPESVRISANTAAALDAIEELPPLVSSTSTSPADDSSDGAPSTTTAAGDSTEDARSTSEGGASGDGSGSVGSIDASPAPVPDSGSADSGPATPGLGALSLDEPSEQRNGQQIESVEQITPDPLVADKDVGELIHCRSEITDSRPEACVYGVTESEHEIAIVGDSHAQEWVTAFEAIAESRGWRLRVLTKAACTYAGVTLVYQERPYDACTAWNAQVRDLLLQEQPDVVIVTGRDQGVVTDGEALTLERSLPALVADRVSRWGELRDNGSRVIVIADTPIPRMDVPECVSEHGSDLRACTFPKADALDPDGGSLAAAARELDLPYLDLTPAICPVENCPVVVGGVLVYRDHTHLSDTYVRTLVPQLAAALDSVGAFETTA